MDLQTISVIVAMIGFSTSSHLPLSLLKRELSFREAPLWRFTGRIASIVILISYFVTALAVVLLGGLLPTLAR